MSRVNEIFNPLRMTASGPITNPNASLGGFFCTTAGTLQITAGITAGGADIVSSFSVLAGTYYPLPFKTKTGSYAVLGGGAAGTFAIGL